MVNVHGRHPVSHIHRSLFKASCLPGINKKPHEIYIIHTHVSKNIILSTMLENDLDGVRTVSRRP
jgi:hypothetical protein